ncbi:MAG: pilin [bacterium]|nr:pilin [bacterium]
MSGGIFKALPSDVRARIQAGNATLDDIVQTGVAFATFLFGLSAALFFVVFVYGGALLLLSFGESGRVTKGKAALKGALIGLFFVMSAWTIVRFVNDSITGGQSITGSQGVTAPTAQTSAKKSCGEEFPGFTCQTLSGSTPQAISNDVKKKNLTCHPKYCPGAANVLCCKSN